MSDKFPTNIKPRKVICLNCKKVIITDTPAPRCEDCKCAMITVVREDM